MSDNVQTVGSGFSISGLLGVAFVVLKLCGVINWSWWWVTAPFWGPFAIALGFVAVALIITVVCMVIAKLFGI